MLVKLTKNDKSVVVHVDSFSDSEKIIMLDAKDAYNFIAESPAYFISSFTMLDPQSTEVTLALRTDVEIEHIKQE